MTGGQRQIAQHKSCAFGVTVMYQPLRFSTLVGNQDAMSAISELVLTDRDREFDASNRMQGTCNWKCDGMDVNWVCTGTLRSSKRL